MLGRRQTTDGEDALDSGSRVIRRIDLRRAHMQLAQPNRRMIGIERHEAIVQDAHGKAKPTGGLPSGQSTEPCQSVQLHCTVRAVGWEDQENGQVKGSFGLEQNGK
ncbi:MAG: hypothetical protein E8D52_13245 [Nitrospira sp.]|nr:MAG: hypothetical protein E8D52_13245 [Nitrospira sp.]